MRSLRYGLLPCMAVVGLTVGLIVIEPDLGTAALIGIIGSLVVLVAGAQVPIGPARTEFGGLPLAPGSHEFLAPPAQLYLQLRRYF